MRFKLIEESRISEEEHISTHVALAKAFGAKEERLGDYILLSFQTLPPAFNNYADEWFEGELPTIPPAVSDVFKIHIRIEKTVETNLFFDDAFVEDAKALIENLAAGDRGCAFENFYRILARQSLYRAGVDAHTE